MTSTPTTPPEAALEAAAGDVLSRVTETRRQRRLLEVAELELAVAWMLRHPEAAPGSRERVLHPGGDGTPGVTESAVTELAFAHDAHPATTRAMMADAADLQHRLPATWAVVVAGECEPWVARKVAVISRPLDRRQAGIVDRAVARMIAGHAPATVIETAQAKVIEADPEAHAARQELSRHQRYVTLSRSDETGYRHVVARVAAGDAAWIDAMVDRVADILALTHALDHNHDELRSMALGWLARPVELVQLLLEHTVAEGPDREAPTDEPPEDESCRPAWAPDHTVETIERLADVLTHAPADRLAGLRSPGRLFVHVTDHTLRTGVGVARIEGVGPIDVAQLHEVLGHAQVTVTPVLDLAGRVRADVYEHAEGLKDHVWLLHGGADAYPHSPRTATRDRVDFDHTTPFVPRDDGGPPGQTGTHNSQPLRRSHHRWKTHAGPRARTCGPGRVVWRTPHGQYSIVDHTGTHRIPPEQGHAIFTAPEGVDLYFGPAIELDTST